MKKRFCLLLVILLLVPAIALADILLVVSTDSSVRGVMLMNEHDEVVSSTLSQTENDNGIDWTLRIINNASSQAALYMLSENGDWLRTNCVYGLSSFGSDQETSTAVPKATSTPRPTPSPTPVASWPQSAYQGISVSVYPLPQDERYQSRSGPSRSYHGVGAYKTYKISSIKALFIEDGYVLVDLDYTTVGRRRLYFPSNIFTSLKGVPEAALTPYPAQTTCALTPRHGPGNAYNAFDEAAIGAGTAISVFFEENGWVFGEFDCALGAVRAWIPVENVQAK